ncbi:MAG: LPS-assembly protein LptD [Flavipsychrobacter sp.]|nr:LPS-assembly protein LptD [Flavipsychrobacter sp.]
MVIFVFFSNLSFAQQDTTKRIINTADTTLADSTALPADSTRPQKSQLERMGLKISKDALTEVVVATARDSAVMNLDSNMFYLYGKAKVTYDDLVLEAGEVLYNQNNNNVLAGPQFDSSGKAMEKPVFTQGSEKVMYDSLQYNFKSKRAIVRNANTQYGEGYLHSQQIKRNPDQSIYGLHNVYTTCALDTPHFGIVAKKIKVIPNRIAASGPANIAIEGVPTPLFLPFGLFPISQKQKSGFILPTYTVEQNRGLGLLNGGYYFHISDQTDLLTQLNIFSKGSWQAGGTARYKNIYHYNGNLQFQYAYNKTGESYEPNAQVGRVYMLNWDHQTDPKARPGQAFTASVNVGSSTFYSTTSYDPLQATNNQFQSNLSYNKSWQNRPFNLTVSGRHNQNTQTKLVDVTLPQIAFNVASIAPFQSKKAVGAPKWYDKITFTYTLNAQNRTSFYDSLFNVSSLKFQNGLSHSIPLSANYTLFRYLNVPINIPYNEYWYTERIDKRYNDVTGKIDTSVQRGFFTAREYSFSLPLTTRIYGMKLFKKGKLRGIRHTLEPGVELAYRPDFSRSSYYYQTRLDTGSALQMLYRYETSSFVGTVGPGEQRNINFGINNNLQIKVRSSKDTVSGFKNITLIDELRLSTGYNFAADSNNWSMISIRARNNILNLISLSAIMNLDQYGYNPATDRPYTQSTMWQRGEGFARFRDAAISASTSLSSKPKQQNGQKVVPGTNDGIVFNPDYYNYVDFDIPWSINLSYALNITNNYVAATKKDTLSITAHNLTFGGDFNVTSRWKVSFQSGYSFIDKKLQATRIQIFRDLHCWAMRLETVPFGPQKNYNFTINVKASVLQDLKLMRRRDFRDSVQ